MLPFARAFPRLIRGTDKPRASIMQDNYMGNMGEKQGNNDVGIVSFLYLD